MPPTVTIPENYVNLSMPAMTFDIYATPMALPYPMYGPPVYEATSQAGSTSSKIGFKSESTTDKNVNHHVNQNLGLEPSDCVATNGNWCGVELSAYSDETGCWNASAACWNQTTVCYATQQPTGYGGCKAWEAKCDGIDDQCNAENYYGPPDAGKILTPAPTSLVGGDQIVRRGISKVRKMGRKGGLRMGIQ